MLSKQQEINYFDYLFRIERNEYFSHTTVGGLYVPNQQNKLCYTLEDTARPDGVKIPSKTAIPATDWLHAYDLGIRYSPGFKRDVPVIYTEEDKVTLKNGDVKFKYAYLHGGNTHKNTSGCPLVAWHRPQLTVIQGSAEKEVTKLVEEYLEKGRVGLQVINCPQENTEF